MSRDRRALNTAPASAGDPAEATDPGLPLTERDATSPAAHASFSAPNASSPAANASSRVANASSPVANGDGLAAASAPAIDATGALSLGTLATLDRETLALLAATGC